LIPFTLPLPERVYPPVRYLSAPYKCWDHAVHIQKLLHTPLQACWESILGSKILKNVLYKHFLVQRQLRLFPALCFFLEPFTPFQNYFTSISQSWWAQISFCIKLPQHLLHQVLHPLASIFLRVLHLLPLCSPVTKFSGLNHWHLLLIITI
jgi:hypothetical protein